MSTDMQSGSPTGQCPIDQHCWSHQKTARPQEPATSPIECDEYGVWHIHGFKEAKAILRSGSVKQAGLGAELFEKVNSFGTPVFYMEGKKHQQYRKQISRFFTPKAVDAKYKRLIEQQVDRFIETIKRKKQVDLNWISYSLVGSVVYKILGLDHSRLPGMQRRLDRFLTRLPDMQHRHDAPDKGKANKIHWNLLQLIETQLRALVIFWLDIQPAIQAHKREPGDDLISHLLTQNYTSHELLTECLTFAMAGIQAPREFICIATWHFLEQPELRARYLAASDEERDVMLQEILRLEPFVERLHRRATEDISVHIKSTNTYVTIPAGALITIHVCHTNNDESGVGEEPLSICPTRELKEAGVTNAVMSFGEGNHRCPGNYIAMREADIFLRRLLSLEGLYIVKEPELSWNDLGTFYTLRNFIIGIA
jgi:cytochrome P450